MNSKGPDQPVGRCSVIRALTVHIRYFWELKNLLVNSEGPDQPAGSCSVIRAFTVM